jgi:hypothetical protein
VFFSYPSSLVIHSYVGLKQRKPLQNLSILQRLTSNISSTQTLRLLAMLNDINVNNSIELFYHYHDRHATGCMLDKAYFQMYLFSVNKSLQYHPFTKLQHRFSQLVFQLVLELKLSNNICFKAESVLCVDPHTRKVIGSSPITPTKMP